MGHKGLYVLSMNPALAYCKIVIIVLDITIFINFRLIKSKTTFIIKQKTRFSPSLAWALRDLNPGPTDYESAALTN